MFKNIDTLVHQYFRKKKNVRKWQGKNETGETGFLTFTYSHAKNTS